MDRLTKKRMIQVSTMVRLAGKMENHDMAGGRGRYSEGS